MGKKKSAAKIIEELDYTLIQIVASCETFKEAKSCPEHMRIWFEAIAATAKRGLDHD